MMLLLPKLGATASQPVGNAKLQADSLAYDRKSSTYQAEGNVELLWNGTTLLADRATFAEQMGLATAEGGVKMLRGDDILTAERLSIDIAGNRGEALKGELFIKSSNFHVKGERIAKTGEADYLLERGSFTTCDGEKPSWKFTASNLEVTLEEFARGRHALFYLADLPVFYTPYMIFPVRRERQSGFLFPRLGSSTKKGFFIDIPYYWAISPSQEATVDLDLQSRRGVGGGIDYRYLGRQESRGSLRGYSIYDNIREEGRAILVAQQQENRQPFTFKSDISLATDRAFYRDFGEASGDYNRQLLDSSLSATVAGERTALVGELRYITDLEVPDNGTTLQKLPQLTLTHLQQRLWRLPLYATVDAGYTNFQRDSGQEGGRIVIRPTLSSNLPLPGGSLTGWGGYRQRFYSASDSGSGDGAGDIGLLEGGAALTSSFNRVYGFDQGPLQRLRHTMMPEFFYSFIETKEQRQLPNFDYDDRPVGQKLLGWSLSNYLTGRYASADGTPTYRELAQIRLSQGYQLDGGRRDLLTLVDEGRRLTDLRIEAKLSPLPQGALLVDSHYGTETGRVSTAGLGLELTDSRGTMTGVTYRYARGELDYLEGKMALALVKPLIFQYTGRYSLDKESFLESYYALEYRHQCWSMVFSYRDRPDNREFLVSFSLSGIGSLGQVKAF